MHDGCCACTVLSRMYKKDVIDDVIRLLKCVIVTSRVRRVLAVKSCGLVRVTVYYQERDENI